MIRDKQGEVGCVISSKYGLSWGTDGRETERQRSQKYLQERDYVNLFSHNHQNSNICQELVKNTQLR